MKEREMMGEIEDEVMEEGEGNEREIRLSRPSKTPGGREERLL